MRFKDDLNNFSNLDDISDSPSIDNNHNKIIILKRVKSIRQLRNSEKELVRLCYKEAVLKGFTVVKDIQCYIGSKSKIWIERSGIEYLKKSEEEENKRWYYHMAKDHFVYIGVYRKAIDQLEQLKKELWSMMLNPATTNLEKIHAIRELHNLTNTYTLLLRDLPFISSLTKYYDPEFSDPNYKKLPESQNPEANENNTIDNEDLIEQKVSERLDKIVNESGLFVGNINKIDAWKPVNTHKNIDDVVMKDMQAQLNGGPKYFDELLNSKKYQESVQRIKDILEE